jgi:hypothetical protein
VGVSAPEPIEDPAPARRGVAELDAPHRLPRPLPDELDEARRPKRAGLEGPAERWHAALLGFYLLLELVWLGCLAYAIDWAISR